MLLKTRTRNVFYDRLHKGTVTALIGLTVVGTVGLAYVGYHRLVNTMNLRERNRLELLKEGAQNKDTTKTLVT